ncbi:2,5-dihydroxypyridine 5,6-dioxygenase [Sphingosinicella xenopeptidilytica]|uniref:2,5-dihydroxypyridine 5,6-dioxygenase n=1 Tax=Sphingosinicella xenopeptidilytica TaxID=364098 RepID=A0ABW3C5I3_SPHXN
MPVSDYDLCEAWKHVLGLCRVNRGDNVTILTDRSTHPQNLRAATIALQSLGAVVTRIDLQPVDAEKALSRDAFGYLGTTPLTGNEAALAACLASDLVVDLMVLLFSDEQQKILESGTRILLAAEPPEILVRLIPTEVDKARVNAAARLLEAASRMHVTSDAGTDVVFSLGQYPAVKEYGFAEERGRWDHWPSGFILTWPNEGHSNGRIVIDRGDIVLPLKRYATGPITLEIKDGYVTSISGGTDAELLREFMESFNDREGYAMSHVGWGLQDRAKWSTLSFYDREQTIGMDARAFAGNFLFSLGPNLEVGGTRNTACHVDVPLRGCSITLDGKAIVERGIVLNMNVEDQ